ncbi:MAG: Asp-tRNA(Asn)/Glu-tRNA(Gln) amidotransferase subunit GatB [Holophagales bacterium]|nr:Asp-tRNA(Asn)/Glu-tRNA(Gln) amidotransferase subunit GatB [Holophagales bacterium]MYH25147.1 Asp-tRNA(Asn)/Glu-tRNA(Gln) amidotransferase subunit GatB [Holophagales bacterium]
MSVAQSTTGTGAVGAPVDTGWETVIGLEVHVQLRTRTKMFCRCENRFGAEPNELVCPVCLGYPGTLPVTNQHAVDLAIRLALALGCEIRRRSVFARKNYFYPDLPKGYQISQYDEPLAEGGGVPLPSGNTVRIHRLHLEEDAGKLLHEVPGGGPLPGRSLVDFNRCGVPLVEIVTEPEIGSPADAQAYLQVLHQVLLYTGASDGNMEEGSLRCDANLSLRPVGETTLGTKTEVKNLNSFRHVAKALEYERERQLQVLTSGGRVEQETRSFEPSTGVTRSLRSKEEAHDYRYFPEPDLPTVVLSGERIERHASQLPELPWTKSARFREAYGLRSEEAALLSGSVALATYYERAVAAHPKGKKTIANWVMTELLRELKERSIEVEEAIAPERLAAVVALVDSGELSATAAKEVLAAAWDSSETPDQIADRLGLRQVRDDAQLEAWADEAIAANEKAVTEYRGGRQQALGYLVGQIMKASRGSAEPRAAQEILRRKLADR